MQKFRFTLAALLFFPMAAAALAQGIPSSVGLRFSEQISNSLQSSSGFAMQGAAADANWKLPLSGVFHLGLAADAAVENTGNVNSAGYGLTLTTFTAGPRLTLPGKKTQPFAQALFGLAHGSGSNFPSGNQLVNSANSFALDAGVGVDHSLTKQLSLRLLQVDYLRTALPNNSNQFQSNLRISAGLTLRLPHL